MPCSAIQSRPWTSTSTPAISRARSASARGREVVGRRVLQLAGEVLGVGADGAAVHGVGDVVVGGDDHLVELARRLVLGARCDSGRSDSRPGSCPRPARRPRRRRRGGAAPSTARACRARARGRGRRPRRRARARRRSASRAPRPTSSQRRPSAWCRARCLKLVRASPASSSAASGAPSRSCATPSSSKTPTAIVSASVAAGASVVAEACIGRPGYVTSLRHMPKTVILGAARTPIGKLGGGLSTIDATELGATAIAAALERADVAPDEVQHVVMGQVLQAGQGQIPSRQAQIKAGIPKEVSTETINKVCASGLRASVLLDQAIRAGDVEVGVGGGMESMSRRALPAAPGALRLPHGRRQGARRDGPRRPHQPLQRAPDVRRGDRDRRRARAHAPRPRPLGAALARARGRGDRRGPPARGDRRRDRQGSQGRHRRRGRRGPAPRHDASRRWPSCPGLVGKEGSHTAGNSPGVNDGGGALVLASDEWAAANGKAALAEIVAHAQSANDFAYLATTPGARGREGAGQGRAVGRRTSTCGRSTRRSPRSRSTRSGCSASTRTRSTSTAARSPSATRSAPRARASSARSCTSCAGAAAAWAARRSAAAAARATP